MPPLNNRWGKGSRLNRERPEGLAQYFGIWLLALAKGDVCVQHESGHVYLLLRLANTDITYTNM